MSEVIRIIHKLILRVPDGSLDRLNIWKGFPFFKTETIHSGPWGQLTNGNSNQKTPTFLRYIRLKKTCRLRNLLLHLLWQLLFQFLYQDGLGRYNPLFQFLYHTWPSWYKNWNNNCHNKCKSKSRRRHVWCNLLYRGESLYQLLWDRRWDRRVFVQFIRLSWIKKTRVKDKTYISVSVRWKTKN
jgi:hypothetical protein